MGAFERELTELLDRTKSIKPPINAAPISVDIDEYNRPSEIWINDVEIFYNNYLTTHSLSDRIKRILDKRDLYAYNQLITCLESIRKDKFFIERSTLTQSI